MSFTVSFHFACYLYPHRADSELNAVLFELLEQGDRETKERRDNILVDHPLGHPQNLNNSLARLGTERYAVPPVLSKVLDV